MHSKTPPGLILTFAVIAVACGSSDSSTATLEDGLALFRQNKMEEAAPIFESLASREPDRAEPYVWLAETYRRLRQNERAVKIAGIALELEPCNTMAHTVMADASVPPAAVSDLAGSDTSWTHLLAAIDCDPTDGNVWESAWGLAIRRDDPGMMRQSVRRMAETGFLTPAALAFGRWLVATLPDNAILITNGDMDTYPAMAVQEAQGLRPDVAVVERGLLNMPWGMRFYRDHLGVPIPLPDSDLAALGPSRTEDGDLVHPADRIFAHWVQDQRDGSATRPVALAATVYRDFFDQVEDDLQYAGPYWRVVGRPLEQPRDTVALRASLAAIVPGDFVGPWVSDQDYSPIRGMTTRNLARSVTHSALVYAEELREAGRRDEALTTVNWAEQFEDSTELGPSLTDRINELRASLAVRQ